MYSGPASGLWTSPNPFDAVPAGSLEVADDVVFTAPGVIEPRRGMSAMANSTFGEEGSLADAIAYYGTAILLAYDFTKIALKPVGDGFTDFVDNFEPNGLNRMRFEPAARSMFFNPQDGIRVFDGQEPADLDGLPGIIVAFESGTGTLDPLSVVTDGTSGAVGASAGAASGATGLLYFRDSTVTGSFGATNPITGAPSFVADVSAVDVLAALFMPQEAASWAVGARVTGLTSGATAEIQANVGVGPWRVLQLTDLTGTFGAEEISVAYGGLYQPSYAGCPPGINITAELDDTSPWMAGDGAVAYRYTVCRKDSFGRIIEGAPSGRTVLRNQIRSLFPADGVTRTGGATVFATTQLPHGLTTGDVVTLTPGEADFPPGAKTITVVNAVQFSYAEAGANVSMTVDATWNIARSAEVTLWLPPDIEVQINAFLRAYRSEETLAGSDAPSDELWQCYESPFLVQADLDAGFVTFIDVAPESVLEVPLYTNPNTGDGTLAANLQPPIAEDFVFWENRMWYLNTTSKQSLELTLIGCGAPDGLQDGDTIGFLEAGGVAPGDLAVFTAKTTPAGDTEFQLFADADPGYNIERTAQAFVQVFNATEIWASAFYISSESGSPGKILFVRDIDGTPATFQRAFSIYSDRPTAWTPQLPDPLDPLWPAPASSNNRHAARLSYSKLGQPESVPLTNFEQIDADNAAGLRCVPLNYRLIIWKTDGVYFVPNTFPPRMQKLSDHVLVAPDSIARLGDELRFMSDQGLMVVDDSGVRPFSIPIDATLTALGGPSSLTQLQQRTVGCAYRSMRQYLCWVVEKADDGSFSEDNEQAFVFSTLGNGFTRYSFGVRAAAIDAAADKLVVAPTDVNELWVENKTLTNADYVDLENDAIPCAVKFNKLTDGEPAVMKLTQQVSFLFKQNGIQSIEATFASEIHPAEEVVLINSAGWGELSWGEEPWGNPVRAIRRAEPIPPTVAECCQLSVGFRTAQLRAKFSFVGIDVISRPVTVANRG